MTAGRGGGCGRARFLYFARPLPDPLRPPCGRESEITGLDIDSHVNVFEGKGRRFDKPTGYGRFPRPVWADDRYRSHFSVSRLKEFGVQRSQKEDPESEAGST